VGYSFTAMTKIRGSRIPSLILILTAVVVSACGLHDDPVAERHDGLIQPKVDDSTPLPVPADALVSPDADPTSKLVTGSLPGSSDVSSDGEAHYSLPLWVPPGRAGMQPSLALEYRSRGGNGPLGVGWALTGLSQITRCPAHHGNRRLCGPPFGSTPTTSFVSTGSDWFPPPKPSDGERTYYQTAHNSFSPHRNELQRQPTAETMHGL